MAEQEKTPSDNRSDPQVRAEEQAAKRQEQADKKADQDRRKAADKAAKDLERSEKESQDPAPEVDAQPTAAQQRPDAAPLTPPAVENDGVKNTATTPFQAMTDVSQPDFVAHAAGLQSETGATPLGFYTGPDPDAEKVSLSSALEAEDGHIFRAKKDVCERFLAPKTVTPQNRWIIREGGTMTEARYEALVAAEQNL